MDKRVVFAVAGSGKTQLIIDALSLEKRSLVITYTVDNARNLETRIKDKFGFFPPNIVLRTYFTFLYSFCFLPFFGLITKTKGISWDMANINNTNPDSGSPSHYFTGKRYIYHNRLAKLILHTNKQVDVKLRIEKYFDEVFIDEVQDFAARDFSFIEELCESDVGITLIGDFHQHTFDTSRDGNYRQNLYKNYEKYLQLFKLRGVTVDTKRLKKSYRCAPEICEFISNRLGINLESHRTDSVKIVIVEHEQEVLEIARNDNIIKLFYQNSAKYNCNSKNWGKSKGEDQYHDVCIVLNGTTCSAYKKEGVMKLAESTRNKLYVACSRARGNLYIVDEKLFKTLKS